MNNSNQSANPAEEKLIPGKVSQMHNQNESLNGGISKDIHGIIDRVRSIGLRFNSGNHPDNVPQCEPSRDGSAKGVRPPDEDGLTGELNKVIDGTADFIGSWNNNFYPTLDKYLSYIERHI